MRLGEIDVQFTGHSGFLLDVAGMKVALDPLGLGERVEKVDLLLLSHGHYDHCSIKDIEKLVRKGTMVVCPADCPSKLAKIEGIEMQVVEAGESCSFGELVIEVVPAYCVGKEFHTKSEGFVGYVLKYGNTILYHCGDSDVIPEMQKLSGYGKDGNMFICLLPVSGTYCMTAEEAASAAGVLHASVAIPMHYGAGVGTVGDAQRFKKLCGEKGIRAEVLEKI
ncbi:MAG TPA: MBL fold metallo-hydrolase [Candidatus Nanoarchaeia archaeon]|nr:MBL fold metallo-hydrolase [Candidatus Nanoarchaeia archaeon]